jgi:secreted trypsin-like serine protease
MRRSLIGAVAAATALVCAGVAAGITNGEPDGSGHPYVGALLAQQAFSDGTWEECTGTLIAPRVFLTAEHCDEGVSRVAVTFDSDYVASTGTTYWGHGTRTRRTRSRTAIRTTSPSSSSTGHRRGSRRRAYPG